MPSITLMFNLFYYSLLLSLQNMRVESMEWVCNNCVSYCKMLLPKPTMIMCQTDPAAELFTISSYK